MAIYFIVAVVAYLLGSIPFGYILMRVFRGEDVRAIGSGNIGATNVARKAPGLGVATLVLDAAKGFAAVYIAMEFAKRSFLHDLGLLGAPDQIQQAALQALHAFPERLYFVASVAAACLASNTGRSERMGGNDRICGLGGDDMLAGGLGDDQIDAGRRRPCCLHPRPRPRSPSSSTPSRRPWRPMTRRGPWPPRWPPATP